MQEVDSTTFDRAARVFADVPEKVEHIGDLQKADFMRADLVPFSAMVCGDAGRETPAEILVVESVGSSVIDAAAASYVFERAEEADLGMTIDFR
jgi:alanine dehydrogenase